MRYFRMLQQCHCSQEAIAELWIDGEQTLPHVEQAWQCTATTITYHKRLGNIEDLEEFQRHGKPHERHVKAQLVHVCVKEKLSVTLLYWLNLVD